MIPKIIHHVWTSNNKFKEKFHSFRFSWIKHNPDWSFYFWTIDNLPESIDQGVLEVLSDEKYNYVIKSDILRLEILKKYGGIYVDTDIECLKSFDDFLNLDFFVGYEDSNFLCNALIGSSQNNVIVENLLLASLENLKNHSVEFSNRHPNKITGPHLYTKIIKDSTSNYKLFEKNIFYPISYKEKKNLHLNNPASYSKHFWSGTDDDGWANN
jgi:mannosyltransferase OCH1-like enzyme